MLYAFEPDGMLDSEKNLRVLWVRALLAAAGELQDDVAAELLPAASRWIVSEPLARTVWAPVLPKLDWVRQRTDFIDKRLDAFLAASSAPSQVILIGSGYDTRSLRYRDAACTFFEVDLPDVLSVKAKMADKFLLGADGQSYAAGLKSRSVGCDLNKAAGTVMSQLEAKGLQRSMRTLVVSEAVLFYLSPPAKRSLLVEAAELVRACESADGASSQLVLTDNLAPFVRSPVKGDAKEFFDGVGLELTEHDTLWGGAIQFVRAE